MLTTAPMPQSAPAHLAKPVPDALLPGALLPSALDAERRLVAGNGPGIALYLSAPEPTEAVRDLTPLVLVHSVNAAASAAELRPLFERYRATRVVVALELPGFGSSERGPLEYTPTTMTAAILRVLEKLMCCATCNHRRTRSGCAGPSLGELRQLVETMGSIVAWSQLRASGRDGSATCS